MNIFTLPITEVLQENIYLMDSKKNILMDGTFSKMIYVDSFFSMNGIYIDFPIKIQKIDNYYFSKSGSIQIAPLVPTAPSVKDSFGPSVKDSFGPSVKDSGPLVPTAPSVKQTVFFSIEKHTGFMSMLETLEKQLLDHYVPLDPNLPKIVAISHTLKSGYFRIFRESNKKPGEFILKISGIWENAKGYGLSYKIVETCYTP